MTPSLTSMISQGEHGVLSSEHKALMSLVLSAEINEQWIEIHYITHNRRQGSMYGQSRGLCHFNTENNDIWLKCSRVS